VVNGYDPYTLLELLGEVVRVADPEHPEKVTQARFDQTAAVHEQFAQVPPARSLSRFFLQGWGDLVELSLRDPGLRERTLAMRARTEQTMWLTAEGAVAALRLICLRLGGVVPTREAYRRERIRLISLAGRDGGLVAEILPTEDHIDHLLDGWDSALHAARLGSLADAPPARRAPSIIDVLDRCYAHHHTEPVSVELELFARANGIPYPRRESGKAFAEYVTEWKQQRLAAGLDIPGRPPRKRDRPDYGVDVGAARPGERRATARWTPELLAPWVDRFLDELPRSTRPTERNWNDWAHTVEGAPNASRVIENGGFSTSIDAGRERRRRARGSLSPPSLS